MTNKFLIYTFSVIILFTHATSMADMDITFINDANNPLPYEISNNSVGLYEQSSDQYFALPPKGKSKTYAFIGKNSDFRILIDGNADYIDCLGKFYSDLLQDISKITIKLGYKNKKVYGSVKSAIIRVKIH